MTSQRAGLAKSQAALDAESRSLATQAERVERERSDLAMQKEQYDAQLVVVRASGSEIAAERMEHASQSAKLNARATALAGRESDFDARVDEHDDLRRSLEARLVAVDTEAKLERMARREAAARSEVAARASTVLEQAREDLVRERAGLLRDEGAVEAARRRLAVDEATSLALERKAERELASLKTTAALFAQKQESIERARSALDDRMGELTSEQARNIELAERAAAEQIRNEQLAASHLNVMKRAAV
jgi:hypothetical protein